MIQLPPYHYDLNAIELIWADEKNYVARENREVTRKSVEALFRERRSQITAEKCKKCIEHVKKVDLSYWKTDRIIDQNRGGGALQLHLYGGMWPQDWRTDPSAD